MSKTIYYKNDNESSPPMAIATPIAEPERVVFDEELSLPCQFLEMEPAPMEVVVAPFEVDQSMMLQAGHHAVFQRNSFRGYLTAATLLSLVGLALLVTVAIYFTSLEPMYSGPSMTSLRELCSSMQLPSSLSPLMSWGLIQHIETGNLNLVAINNETIVGVKGQTMLETRTLGFVSWEVPPQVQFYEGIQTLILAENGILVVSIENDHVYMLSRKGGGSATAAAAAYGGSSIWQVVQEFAKPARRLDSNGNEVLLWTGTDVHVFSSNGRQQQGHVEQHIASLQSVASLKLSQDGSHIFIAAPGQVRVFRRQQQSGRWVAQESIWLQTRKDESQQDGRERKVKEEEEVQLSVSADGSVIAIRRTADMQIFTFRSTWIRVGGDDGLGMVSSLVTVSNSGERVAIATNHESILVMDKTTGPDSVEAIAEIPIVGEVRALFFPNDDHLEVVVGDTMQIYESPCGSLIGN
jgi:hypothetical protein